MADGDHKSDTNVGTLNTYTNLLSEMLGSWLRNSDPVERREIVISLLVVSKCCLSSLSASERADINIVANTVYNSLKKL